jgi:uracil phosphoribosyltransferase
MQSPAGSGSLARSGLSRVAALAQMIPSAYHGHISICQSVTERMTPSFIGQLDWLG